ncbi:MAG: oxygen-independent coproporphyrinogen oxidase-like protein [Nevskia sp.]|nr:oxygen-independent coproporphyrinogen oxidase-like protein [Nevskia sp.]
MAERIEVTAANVLRQPAIALPLALYLHFPWCVRKCPYCDFNSHTARGELDETAYVDALIRDLEFELRDAEPRALTSIFMGGGTPSLFSGAAITRALREVQRRIAFASDIEITLEANPGTADAQNFREYRAAGVNRLSIGVQSFDDTQLKRLGRIHAGDEALRAYDTARAAGFDNINLDLMFALPQQQPEAALADLQQAIALAPEHLSYYQLTLEPNTEFAAHPPPLPDDDIAWSMQQQGQALLAEHGYAQYEVSAYARAGRQCRHNRTYWEFGDYLGIGAGAHGKRSFVGGDHAAARTALQIVRRARHKHPRTYLQAAGSAAAIQEEREVSAAELPFEYTMNALRLNEGFRYADFETRTGLAATALQAGLNLAQARGLTEGDAASLRASTFGRAHLNALLREFI